MIQIFPDSVPRPKHFAAILVACLCFGCVGQSKPTQEVSQLQAFFEALVQHHDPKTLPTFDEAMKVIDQTASMRPGDISAALPSILAAFKYNDDTVKGDAATAIFSIGQRSDGAALLKPYATAIGNGLDMPNPHVQGTTVQLLAMLGPEAQSETVPLLVAFVKRRDRDPIAQTSAFSLLLQIAPENPDLIGALQDFVARPLDEQTKEAVINGIANSHTENLIATDILIGALADPSEGVRFQAAQGIQRMPKDMVIRAKPALQKVIDRPDESEEVKTAAKGALQTTVPSH